MMPLTEDALRLPVKIEQSDADLSTAAEVRQQEKSTFMVAERNLLERERERQATYAAATRKRCEYREGGSDDLQVLEVANVPERHGHLFRGGCGR